MLMTMRWICVIGLIACVAGCGPQDSGPTVFNVASAPIVEFNVPDMMCEEGCAATVTEILSGQPGVTDVRVNFEAKKATVAIEEGRFNQQQALAALIDKGFDNSALVGAESELSPAVQ
jgi:copper chaperone CopZ